MAFNTKLRFSCAKFWQDAADTIELSGCTSIGSAFYLETLTDPTPLQIPTAAWVTGQTGAISAANGLCRVDDNITLGGALTGDTKINGAHNLNINVTAFNVTGGTDIQGAVAMSSTLAVAGATDINNTLNVLNGTSLQGALDVTGDTSVTTLDASGAVDLNSTLNVAGASSLQGALDVTGDTSVNLRACDYEDDFVPRSLVTAQYVTGYTQDVSNTVAVCNVNTAYTATTENDFIEVSGATSVWLPLSPKACQRITVADIEGDALTNMIVICGNGIDINGSPTATINTNYGSMTFINNNISGWSAVAFIN